MKKLLSLVLLFLIGCSSEPINIDEMLIERGGIFYTKDTNKPYTGPVFSLYDENGQLKQEGTMKDGSIYGPFKMYHENGQLWIELTFKDGKSDGLQKQYYENGQLWSEKTYKNGLKNGPFTIYDENGKLIEEGIYEDGEIVSSKKYD